MADQTDVSPVLEILNRKDAAGAFVYSDAEVKPVFALLVLTNDLLKDPTLPEVLLQVTANFLEGLGIDLSNPEASETGPDVVKAYFEANPINPRLLRELHALGMRLAPDAAPTKEAFETFQGQRKPEPVPEGERVKNKPGARFSLRDWKPD